MCMLNQPSSSREARARTAPRSRVWTESRQLTSWLERNHWARGPLLKIAAGIRDLPRDRQREQGSHQLAQDSQCWLSLGRDWTPSQQRVEGSDSLSTTPSGASQTSEPSRDWGERDVDERLNNYSAILTWPDEVSGEHSSSLFDCNVM